MDNFWQDAKYGARMLLRSRGVTLLAVLTLALGIGANTAIFSVVSGVLLQPLPYDQPERMVALAEDDHTESEPINVSFGTFVEWKVRARSLESMAVYGGFSPTLLGGDEPEPLRGTRVTEDFFRVLGVRPALGRDFLPEEHHWETRRVVLLSHRLWQRRFGGDPEIVGKTTSLGGTPHMVVGVLPADFQPVLFSSSVEPIEIWAPLGYEPSQPWACRSCRHLQAVGRIGRNATLAQVAAEMDAVERSLTREYPNDYVAGSTVLTLPARERLVGKVREPLLVLLGAVGFVLLIGCANVANLLLARAASRQREMAIRTALGAGRSRLMRQVLTESTLLAMAGGALGILLAVWTTDLLLGLAPDTLPRQGEVGVNGTVLAAIALVTLLTGLLIGLGPAIGSGRMSLTAALKEGGRGSTGTHQRLRSVLVVTEVAMALLLVVGAGLLIRSFVALLGVHPGFDTRDVLTLNTFASGPRYPDGQRIAQFYGQAFERLRALPGVEAVGLVTPLPITAGFDRSGLHIEERPLAKDSDAPYVDRYYVAGDYLRAMRIPLRRGRDMTDEEKLTGAKMALVSESLARVYFSASDPIGKRIRLGGPHDPLLTIVGIVGDVRQYGLDTAPVPQVYTTGAMEPGLYLTVVVRAANAASLAHAVRQEIWAVDKERPIFQIATMEEVVSASLARRRFTMLLLGAFAAVALLLASVGIYGVLAYTVTQRTQEIGIRVALGAQRTNILRLILGRGMALTLAGIGLGLVGSLALTRFTGSLLFGVTATDPATYVSVSLLLTLVALAACYIPARRATRVDPMVALRYE